MDIATIKTIIALMMLVLAMAEGTVYQRCFQGGYCFYTTGELVIQQSRSQLEKECASINSLSRPLEFHTQAMQRDFGLFLEDQNLKLENVFINLIRVDGDWKWLDGTPFKDDRGIIIPKEYYIDISSEPFAFVNRLSNKLVIPNNVDKSVLSELDKYLCSFKGPCANSDEAGKFQVGEMCYIYKKDNGLNWMNAYTECFTRNSTLAIILPSILADFKVEAKKVLEVNHPYWIGLSKVRWEWVSKPGKLIDFYNWYHGYPKPNTISESPSKVFAHVQPENGYIWVDGEMRSASLVCMTKSSDEDWALHLAKGVEETNKTKTTIETPVALQSICDYPFSWKTARTAIIAIAVILGILLIASLAANIVLAVMLFKKRNVPIVPVVPEKKEATEQFFHYSS